MELLLRVTYYPVAFTIFLINYLFGCRKDDLDYSIEKFIDNPLRLYSKENKINDLYWLIQKLEFTYNYNESESSTVEIPKCERMKIISQISRKEALLDLSSIHYFLILIVTFFGAITLISEAFQFHNILEDISGGIAVVALFIWGLVCIFTEWHFMNIVEGQYFKAAVENSKPLKFALTKIELELQEKIQERYNTNAFLERTKKEQANQVRQTKERLELEKANCLKGDIKQESSNVAGLLDRVRSLGN